jgi:anti-sigma factor RsiW
MGGFASIFQTWDLCVVIRGYFCRKAKQNAASDPNISRFGKLRPPPVTSVFAAVQRYLGENLEAARRVADYQAQREVIREAFAARSAEPLPAELSLIGIIAERSRRPRMPWLIAASVVFALGLGAAGGWFLHNWPQPGLSQRAMALLGQQALASHVVYAADARHPVEVPGTDAPHLEQWLSARLNRVGVVPDLSAFGYHLVGGRLLATSAAVRRRC